MRAWGWTLCAVLIAAGCGGGSGGSTIGTDTTPGNCAGDCATADSHLSVADVQSIIARGVAEAGALGVDATLAVVDRVGNVLAVYRTGPQTVVLATDRTTAARRDCRRAGRHPSARGRRAARHRRPGRHRQGDHRRLPVHRRQCLHHPHGQPDRAGKLQPRRAQPAGRAAVRRAVQPARLLGPDPAPGRRAGRRAQALTAGPVRRSGRAAAVQGRHRSGRRRRHQRRRLRPRRGDHRSRPSTPTSSSPSRPASTSPRRWTAAPTASPWKARRCASPTSASTISPATRPPHPVSPPSGPRTGRWSSCPVYSDGSIRPAWPSARRPRASVPTTMWNFPVSMPSCSWTAPASAAFRPGTVPDGLLSAHEVRTLLAKP
jgi:hypothetical protein